MASLSSLFAGQSAALLLLLFVFLGIAGHNPSVTVSALVVLLVQQTALVRFAPLVEKYGLQAAIVILTVAVLMPLVTGKVKPEEIGSLLSSWPTVAAVLVGVFVAWLGGRGVHLMSAQPTVVAGLLVGTMIGVAFFKGVPVGPLIAAGILSLVVWR